MFARPAHQLLTVLHKTTSLLPRALPSLAENANSKRTECLDTWQSVLSDTYNDLSSIQSPRPAKITVYGFDEWSGARELVTSLLEEPFSSDDELNSRIRHRWRDRADQRFLTIFNGAHKPSLTDGLAIQSTYLAQLPMETQITEFKADPSLPLANDEAAVHSLLSGDISVLLCNPLTTAPQSLDLSFLARKPNKFLILCSATSLSDSDYTEYIERILTVNKLDSFRSRVLCVDPLRAVKAIDLLRANSPSPLLVQRYQDEFIGSKVSSLSISLKETLEPHPETIRLRTAASQVLCALSACHISSHHAKEEINQLLVAVQRINDKLEETKVRMEKVVLGSSDQATSEESDAVDAALRNAQRTMKEVMDDFTWWKMIWRVDEITYIVRQAVEKAWCKDLEQELILQAGRLTVLQEEIDKSTFILLKHRVINPLDSPVLSNLLQQQAVSPSHQLKPLSLTGPIATRQRQLVQFSTVRLHTAGQHAVLGMTGGILTGTAITGVSWFAQTGGVLENVFAMDPVTALGVGTLSAVLGVRWAVGKWERAKQRWWEDWDRVGAGLKRDLKTTLETVLQNNVLALGQSGCEGLFKLINERREQVEEINAEIEQLRSELASIEQLVTDQPTPAE